MSYQKLNRERTKIEFYIIIVHLNGLVITNMKISKNKKHKEISGNPSTFKENKLNLNDRSNSQTLNDLSESDLEFWKSQGYGVIKKQYLHLKLNIPPPFMGVLKIKNDSSKWYQTSRA